MNLFIVRNSKTGKLLKHDDAILTFERKERAKEARRMANGRDEEGNEQFSAGWTVSRGPDHRHWT